MTVLGSSIFKLPLSLRLSLTVVATLAFVFTAPVALAQTVPATVDPLRQAPQMPERSFEVSPEETIDTPSSLSSAQYQNYEKISLILNDITLTGVTVYAKSDLEAEYKDYIGREVTLADVFRLADRLTAKYHEDGYIFAQVRVPPQEIKSGKIQLTATEGRIGNVDIESQGELSSLAMRMIDDIRYQSVFNLNFFEKKLYLINDLGGAQARAIFYPIAAGLEKDRSVGLKLVFENKKSLSSIISFDNRGSKFTGPYRGHITSRIRDTPLRDDEITISGSAAAPLQEMRSLSASYTKTITKDGLKASFDIARTLTEPGGRLSLLDLQSEAATLRTALTLPIIRSRSENFIIGSYLELSYSKSKILDAIFYKDNLRILGLTADWQNADSYKGVNFVRAQFSHGLPFLGGSQNSDTDLSRENGKTDFSKLELTMARQQYLMPGWTVTTTAGGQYAAHPLLSAQEIGFGGANIGRAYDSSIITGDQGIYAALELRYSGLKQEAKPWLPELYTFYDIGKVKKLKQADNKIESAASLGFGLDWTIPERASIRTEMAKPLTRSADSDDNDQNPRYFLSINFEF